MFDTESMINLGLDSGFRRNDKISILKRPDVYIYFKNSDVKKKNDYQPNGGKDCNNN